MPTRARHVVLLLAFFAAVITYLDRVCISVAAPSITSELGLTAIEMGYVFGAFNLAYAIFEVPAAWLGDRWGQRITMTRIVGAWSIFTMLTGAARSYVLLIATRFAFGSAEAGAFPTLSRALSRWFPADERSRANGVMWMGARLGGAISPPLAVMVIGMAGWRAAFTIFGCAGLIWCIVFYLWFRDDPAEHKAVNAAELARIRSMGTASAPETRQQVPWRKVLFSGDMLALFWAYFASGFGFQFFVSWLPTYFMKEHGLSLQKSGMFAALPLASGAVGCIVGGLLSDWLVRRTGSLVWGRRIVGAGGFLLGAVGFASAMYAKSAEEAIFWLAFGSATHDLTLPVAWSTCVDVGGKFGGTASGYMNLASSISGVLSPVAAPFLVRFFGTFHPLFAITAGAYLIGGLLWFYIHPTRSATKENIEHASH